MQLLCQLKDTVLSDQTNLHQLWKQMFCCCKSKVVEQASSSSETNWHLLQPVYAAAEDIFEHWERNALWLTVKCTFKIILFTYLLTYLKKAVVPCLSWCSLEELISASSTSIASSLLSISSSSSSSVFCFIFLLLAIFSSRLLHWPAAAPTAEYIWYDCASSNCTYQ